MASTLVEGNRVTIDGMVYDVIRAGDGYFSVHDEFGHTLGYLKVRGKTITPEDYKVDGAPPLMEIARPWGAVNLESEKAASQASKGVCWIGTHEAVADADLAGARVYRAWLKKQPGIRSSYLVRDPATGGARSINIWKTRAQLDAAMAIADPEGIPLKTTSVDVFPFVEEP